MKTFMKALWDLLWLEVRLLRFVTVSVLVPALVLLAKGIVYTAVLTAALVRKAQLRWRAHRQAKADQFIC